MFENLTRGRRFHPQKSPGAGCVFARDHRVAVKNIRHSATTSVGILVEKLSQYIRLPPLFGTQLAGFALRLEIFKLALTLELLPRQLLARGKFRPLSLQRSIIPERGLKRFRQIIGPALQRRQRERRLVDALEHPAEKPPVPEQRRRQGHVAHHVPDARVQNDVRGVLRPHARVRVEDRSGQPLPDRPEKLLQKTFVL
ncbi:MAG: hypothetical protein ACI4P3_06585 [Candidatus Spyradosoma sp.]